MKGLRAKNEEEAGVWNDKDFLRANRYIYLNYRSQADLLAELNSLGGVGSSGSGILMRVDFDHHHGEDEVSDVEVPADVIVMHLDFEKWSWSYCCWGPRLPGREDIPNVVGLMAVVTVRFEDVAVPGVEMVWRRAVSEEVVERVWEGLSDRGHGLGDPGVGWDTIDECHVLRVEVWSLHLVLSGSLKFKFD